MRDKYPPLDLMLADIENYNKVDDFDALSKTDAAFREAVQKFVEARDGDLVSSDREAAAFMLAYDAFMEKGAA